MRQYAKVSPRIWTGSLGRELRGDSVTMVVALYLATCPHANMLGLYHLPSGYACADLKCSPAKFKSSLKKLERLGYCQYDPENEIVWVVEYFRHEIGTKPLVNNDKRLIGASSLLVKLSASPLTKGLADHYSIPFEAPSKPLASPLEVREQRTTNNEQGTTSKEHKHPCPANGVSETDIKDVFERHLTARKKYFSRKNGRTPSALPDLTPEIRRAIRGAIERHGKDKAMAAGVGIFYSEFHTGEDSGQEYLHPHLCWRIQTGKTHDVNNVERFSELAIEKEASLGFAN